MTPLNAQRSKRARRQAAHEARRANKATPPSADTTIYATRVGNVFRRKWMKKHGVLRTDIATSLHKAIAEVPTTWTKTCRVVLEPGTYAPGNWVKP